MRTAKRVLVGVVAAGLVAVSGAVGMAEGSESGSNSVAKVTITPQTTCPVMGGKINKDLYVDYEGKRIYVCCGGCIKKLTADPAAYIKKMEQEGITLDNVPLATGPAKH